MNAPNYLDRTGKIMWRRLVESITPEQYEVLSAYCSAYSELVLATNELNKDGRNALARNGYPIPAPAVQRQRQAWSAINQLSQRLGIGTDKTAKTPIPEKWQKFHEKHG